MRPDTLIAEPWADYGLVDSGHGRKLERYGPHRFIRPEPQALWAPAAGAWDADGEFIPGSDDTVADVMDGILSPAPKP